MRQIAMSLPRELALCQHGHTPHLVHTFGTPAQHRIGDPCHDTWHIECARCATATIPSHSRAIAELRWTDATRSQRIPLSKIGQARARVLASRQDAA